MPRYEWLRRVRPIVVSAGFLITVSLSPHLMSVVNPEGHLDQAVLERNGEIEIRVSLLSNCIPVITPSEPVEKIYVRNTWEDALLLEEICEEGVDCLTRSGGETTEDYQGSVETNAYDQLGYKCHGHIEILVEKSNGETGTLLYASEFHPARESGLGCGGI